MRDHFSYHLRNKKKMIVVYPNYITSFVLAYNDVGKCLVDFNVMLPTLLLPNFEFRIIRNLIMKCWPDNLLAIAIVVTFKIGVGNEYRNGFFVGGKIVGNV